MWIKPCFAWWVHPVRCIPSSGLTCSEVLAFATGVCSSSCLPLITLYKNKQPAFDNFSLGVNGSCLYSLSPCVSQLVKMGSNSPELYSSHRTRDIRYNKLGKVAKWNICSGCCCTEALSGYEFPFCILGAVTRSWEWVWKAYFFQIKRFIMSLKFLQ